MEVVIYLNQAMDKLLTDSITVTGSSLKDEGGTLVYINNDLDEDGNLDNIIYSQSQDNSLGEPFGITFEDQTNRAPTLSMPLLKIIMVIK